MPKIAKVKDFIFYKNKKLKDRYGNLHPSIDLGISNDGKWINIPITSSPTKKGRYIEFDENPDPTKRQKKNGSNVYPSFFQKYVRHDKISDKSSKYETYYLVYSDKEKVNNFLKEHEINKRKDQENRENAIKRKTMQSYVTTKSHSALAHKRGQHRENKYKHFRN